jgi:hypothetical protein
MGIETAMSFGGGGGAGAGPAAPGGPARGRQVLHTVQLVRARHFYGYQAGESLFVKVVL